MIFLDEVDDEPPGGSGGRTFSWGVFFSVLLLLLLLRGSRPLTSFLATPLSIASVTALFFCGERRAEGGVVGRGIASHTSKVADSAGMHARDTTASKYARKVDNQSGVVCVPY